MKTSSDNVYGSWSNKIINRQKNKKDTLSVVSNYIMNYFIIC